MRQCSIVTSHVSSTPRRSPSFLTYNQMDCLELDLTTELKFITTGFEINHCPIEMYEEVTKC